MTTTPLLSIGGLTKRYGGFTAVDDLSFDVAAGERVALIGPNGAGKTTAFNMIGGQMPPDYGSVVLAGRDVTGWRPHRLAGCGLGRSFQLARVFPSMTVIENLQTAFLIAAGETWRFVRPAARYHGDTARAALADVGLEAAADRPAADLAYGDIKRLELAIVLAGRPRLVLLDEPTAGMSATARQGLIDLVTALVDRDGLTLLFTEHDVDLVFRTARRVMVMHHGRLIADGTPEAVRANPTVREVYLGSRA